MIVFDLQCQDGGDVFEAWFRSNADFDEQCARGLVQCPACQSPKVMKAPMAPSVRKKGSGDPTPLAQLAALQAAMLKGSEWVGDGFVAQARSMHLGEAEPRPVHGNASPAEARALIEEGVPVAPLPLPVLPPTQVN